MRTVRARVVVRLFDLCVRVEREMFVWSSIGLGDHLMDSKRSDHLYVEKEREKTKMKKGRAGGREGKLRVRVR